MYNQELAEIILERSMPVTESGCWLWLASLTSVGYGDFRLKSRHYTAHRASYLAFKGEIPQGMHILHSCDTKQCCNPDHLRAGSNRENIIDSCTRGGRSKLTADMVVKIREYRTGHTLSETARKFGLSMCNAQSITCGRQWKFVGGPITPPFANKRKAS